MVLPKRIMLYGKELHEATRNKLLPVTEDGFFTAKINLFYKNDRNLS